nr:uncharacterized protein LOC117224012 [Megalopta genalis]
MLSEAECSFSTDSLDDRAIRDESSQRNSSTMISEFSSTKTLMNIDDEGAKQRGVFLGDERSRRAGDRRLRGGVRRVRRQGGGIVDGRDGGPREATGTGGGEEKSVRWLDGEIEKELGDEDGAGELEDEAGDAGERRREIGHAEDEAARAEGPVGETSSSGQAGEGRL